MNKAREFDQSVLAELKALLGERVSTSAAVREHHGKDESYFPYALPDAVVFPESTEEVRDVVNICRRHRVPMIPFGVGTSLEGHILAVNGGVTIDLSQMNQVLEVHEAGLARRAEQVGGAVDHELAVQSVYEHSEPLAQLLSDGWFRARKAT